MGQKKVSNERERALELRCAWKPLVDGTNGFGTKNGSSLLFEPLQKAYTGKVWPKPLLHEIGMVMQLWDGPGSFDGRLDGQFLSTYLSRLKKKELKAVKVVSKDTPPVRWRSWTVVYVADLILKHGVALRRLLGLDEMPEVVPTKEERLVEAAARITELEAQLAEARTARDKAQNAFRKAALRNKEAAETKRAAIKKAKANKAAQKSSA